MKTQDDNLNTENPTMNVTENELISDNMAEETKDIETNETATDNQQATTEKTENTDEATGKTWEEKHIELNDRYLRLVAEYDNYRRRTLKERMELIKTAGDDILKSILPVLDNFERALKSVETTQDITAVKDGIVLIYNNFKDFVSQRGVKEIEAMGKDLDTDLHEAITTIPSPTPDMKGKIIDVIEKGYILHEKVIRFSKVVVGQ